MVAQRNNEEHPNSEGLPNSDNEVLPKESNLSLRRSKMRGRICFRPAALWPIEIHKEFRKSDYINSSENTHQIGRAAAVNSCSVPMNAIWDLLNHAIKRVDPLKLSELIKSQAATTKHHHFRRIVPMILRNRTWNSGENSIDWNFRLNSWFCRFLTLAAESQPVKQSKYQFSTSSCQRKHKITCCYNTFSLVATPSRWNSWPQLIHNLPKN